MSNRQRIRVMLRRKDLPPDHRFKLYVVLLARQFAKDEIGLKTTAAYTRFYDTGGKPLAHNLSASPPDSLSPYVWRFPVVGELPFIGFFDEAAGRRAEEALKQQGLDTYYRGVAAFSSLGWFADPVYSPMLEDDVGRLVDLVLHETTHTTIFVRGQIAFNESLAMFVGNQGALDFLGRLYGPVSPEVEDFKAKLKKRRLFSLLVTELYDRLDHLYRGPLPRSEKLRLRETHFSWARDRYKAIFPDPAAWGSFVKEPLNNAVLLSFGRYNQGIEFHRKVYRCLGSDLSRLIDLYRDTQDPIRRAERLCHLKWHVTQRL